MRVLFCHDGPLKKDENNNYYGITGHIIEQQDSYDLIKKIEKYLMIAHTNKKVMGLCERKKIENEFDRKIVIDSYLQEIKGLKDGA